MANFSRMGSFNSAPKILNSDSQDDNIVIPAGMRSCSDVVDHCKAMRGDRLPQLLKRSFFKPIEEQKSSELAAGLRRLDLNNVSKGFSIPCIAIYQRFNAPLFVENSLQLAKNIAGVSPTLPVEHFVAMYVWNHLFVCIFMSS